MIILNKEPKHGSTVGQKLDAIWEVKGNESCIRTSSGFILATAYTFLSTLKVSVQQEEDFQRIKIVL